MAYYGIDLGTSNCLVARLKEGYDDGEYKIECLRDSDGEEFFPSVVHFSSSDHYTVGEDAAKYLAEDPDSTVELVKVRLGKTNEIPLCVNGACVEKSPQEITAILLKHMNESHRNRITSPVVTVPANFDQCQKNATMQAGELSGIRPRQLVEEPTAAMLYQIYSEYEENGENAFSSLQEKTVLVFDFGGGTLDLSVIKRSFSNGIVKPEVLAVGGDENLGGNLIDFLFTRRIIMSLKKKYKNDHFVEELSEAYEAFFENYITNHILSFPANTRREVKQYIYRLKRHAESLKIELSSKQNAQVVLSGNYEKLPISRAQFEKMVLEDEALNIKEKITEAIKKLAEVVGANTFISEALLVGGSSQIPRIKEIVIDAMNAAGIPPKGIVLSSEYSTAVAKGAAIQAALLDGVPLPPFKESFCASVVARDIYLECGNKGSEDPFVKHGTGYPFSKPEQALVLIPHALSENVPIRLLEMVRNEKGTYEKKPICDYRYYLPIFYTGDCIEVSMNINEAGLYQVEATHLATGEKVEFEPKKSFALSENDMNKVSQRLSKMVEI